MPGTCTQRYHTVISPDAAYISGRSILERLSYLDTCVEADEITAAQMAERAALRRLCQDGEAYAIDWFEGATLIRDSEFTAHARAVAGLAAAGWPAVARAWPYTCIDWDAAAEELRRDYTALDFDGVTYWVR